MDIDAISSEMDVVTSSDTTIYSEEEKEEAKKISSCAKKYIEEGPVPSSLKAPIILCVKEGGHEPDKSEWKTTWGLGATHEHKQGEPHKNDTNGFDVKLGEVHRNERGEKDIGLGITYGRDNKGNESGRFFAEGEF